MVTVCPRSLQAGLLARGFKANLPTRLPRIWAVIHSKCLAVQTQGRKLNKHAGFLGAPYKDFTIAFP